MGQTESGRQGAQQSSRQQHSALAGSSGGTVDWPSGSEGCATVSSASGSSPGHSGSDASAEALRQHSLEPAARASAAAARGLPHREVSGSASLQGHGSSTLESAIQAAAPAPSCRLPLASAQVEVQVRPSRAGTEWAASLVGAQPNGHSQDLLQSSAACSLEPGRPDIAPAAAPALPDGPHCQPASWTALQAAGRPLLPEQRHLESPALQPRSLAPVGRVVSALAASRQRQREQKPWQDSDQQPLPAVVPPSAASLGNIFDASFHLSGSGWSAASHEHGMAGSSSAVLAAALPGAGPLAAAQPAASAAAVASQQLLKRVMSGSMQGHGSSTHPALDELPSAQAEPSWLARELRMETQPAVGRAGWAASSDSDAAVSQPGQLQAPASVQLQLPAGAATAPTMPGGPLAAPQRQGPERSLMLLAHGLLPSQERVGGPAGRGGFGQWQQTPQACRPPSLPPHPALANAPSYGGSFNSSSSGWSSASLAPAASLPMEPLQQGSAHALGASSLGLSALAPAAMPGRQTSLHAERSLEGGVPAWNGHGPAPTQPTADALQPAGSHQPSLPHAQSLESDGGIEVRAGLGRGGLAQSDSEQAGASGQHVPTCTPALAFTRLARPFLSSSPALCCPPAGLACGRAGAARPVNPSAPRQPPA